MSAEHLPSRIFVVRSRAGLRRGDELRRDTLAAGLYVGPSWVAVSTAEIVRGWGVFYSVEAPR